MKKYILIILFAFMSATVYSQYKPTITILDFVGSGVSDQEKSIIIDYLANSILQSGQYRVIDRAQRDTVLAEIKFSLSGCTDQSCQLEAGKLLQADNIIVGSLGRVGSLFILNLKLIAVETGETANSSSDKFTSIETLIDNSEKLVSALLQTTESTPSDSSNQQNIHDDGAKPSSSHGKSAEDERNLESDMNSALKSQEYYDYLNRINLAEFTDWLKNKGYYEKYSKIAVEDKLEYIKDYFDREMQRWTMDIGLSLGFIDTYALRASISAEDYSYSIAIPFDFCYHFSNAMGLSIGLSPGFYFFQETEDLRHGDGYSVSILTPHLSVIFGNKTDLSFAFGIKSDLLVYNNYYIYLEPDADILSTPNTIYSSGLILGNSFGITLSVYYQRYFVRADIMKANFINSEFQISFDFGYSFRF